MGHLPGDLSVRLLTAQGQPTSRFGRSNDSALLRPRCTGMPHPSHYFNRLIHRKTGLKEQRYHCDLRTASSSKGSLPVEDKDLTVSTGGNGSDPPSINLGNGKGDNEKDDDNENEENFELLNLAEADAIASKNGLELPADFAAAAQGSGLRLNSLQKMIDLRDVFFVGFLMRSFPWIRDRLIADPRFLFKVLAEVSIDSGCCTLAEVRKRGPEFWDEFEFYLSDMIVGIVLDVALVSLLAPVAVVGKYPKHLQQSGFKKWLGRLPSAAFEAPIPGVRDYSIIDRVFCYFVKGIQYGGVGLACGFVGQGLANGCMMLRRMGKPESDDQVPIPPLFKATLVWGLFMCVSANTRYQIVVGLERMVDLTLAKNVPQVAYGTTVLIRFLNNIVGGENFIDMARWAGVQ